MVALRDLRRTVALHLVPSTKSMHTTWSDTSTNFSILEASHSAGSKKITYLKNVVQIHVIVGTIFDLWPHD